MNVFRANLLLMETVDRRADLIGDIDVDVPPESE